MTTPDLQHLLQRYGTGRYRPATFLERGVALPLTTPQLLGARIRPAERKGLELVLPHPAGAEGVYILPWSALHDFCAPTLHDRALWDEVRSVTLLAPLAVREAARRVAAAGFAGRAAARAAGAAVAAHRDDAARSQYALLLRLLRQEEPPNTGLPPPERDRPANIQLRIRAVLRHRAAELPPHRALAIIEELAQVFGVCGESAEAPAPLPRLLKGLRRMTREITDWAELCPPENGRAAQLVVAATELTVRCAERSLADLRAPLDDFWALMLRWDSDTERMAALATRPEWVLDGWDMLSGLWHGSNPGAREEVLADLALLVPVIPAEVRDWLGFDAEGDMERHRSGLRTWRRMVRTNQDWLSGRLLETPARGEALREACA